MSLWVFGIATVIVEATEVLREDLWLYLFLLVGIELRVCPTAIYANIVS